MASVDYLSPRKTRSLLALTIFFFSASQLGIHFWPESALLYGLRIDYLAPTIYLLDLLVVLYLVTHFFKKKRPIFPTAIFFLPLLVINLLYSMNPIISLVWSGRLFLYLSLLDTLSTRDLKNSLTPLTVVATIEILLALAQVILGRSLQGIFYWFGERMFTLSSPNIAKSSFFKELALRAYGSFSHPNALSGWLVGVFIFACVLKAQRKLIVYLALLVFFSLVLTQSLTSAFAFFVLALPLCVLNRALLPKYFIVLTLIALPLFPYISRSRSLRTSLGERLKLEKTSLSIVRAFPLFGVGSSSSLTAYTPNNNPSRLLQPDHNSLTLMGSWFGLAGIISLFIFFANRPRNNLRPFLPLLPLLLFDHFLLTSVQGLFILLLIFKSVGTTYD
ncbi:MAG: hypothetical protein UY18_C0002G0019 [Microgenomates group bacterium GW2011_GWF2_47_9]|nr:MAG: hypothetical protein UY18_C0002G0019 [Microgenomates group bacterium GW2011_GWF2_47_9]